MFVGGSACRSVCLWAGSVCLSVCLWECLWVVEILWGFYTCSEFVDPCVYIFVFKYLYPCVFVSACINVHFCCSGCLQRCFYACA